LRKTDDPPVEPSDDDFVSVAMRHWERWIATVLGLTLGDFGVWAVFKTSNQAGSAILLIISAAFLLIGIQGTPLIKIGGSTANLELERRRRRWEQTIKEAKSEPNPEVAQGMIEAAAIMEPELTLSPRSQSSLYIDRVGAALRRLFEEVVHEPPNALYDFAVKPLWAGPRLTSSTSILETSGFCSARSREALANT
jgi:hypothetical protein